MRRLVIVGNGSYSRMMNRYIALTDFGEVAAYTADAVCIQEKELDGLPVVPIEALQQTFPCEEVSLIMGIGYKRMGQIRKMVYERCKNRGYHFENYIHPTAIVEKNVVLGEGNNILEGVIIEESVVLGNANLFFGGSLIGHETLVGDYNTVAGKAVVAGCVEIRNNCFIGVGAAVRDNVMLNDYVFIGATAYAFRSMEEYAVVVPAKSMVVQDKKSIEIL